MTDALHRAGRDIADIEMAGGARARFDGADDVAGVADAMVSIPAQLDAGFSTFCMKPTQHAQHMDEVPSVCRQMVEILASSTRH